MKASRLSWTLLILLLPRLLWGQVPLDKMSLANRLMAGEIVRRPDFTFKTETPPAHVRLATMEKLFDHPRLAAAMWRECQFAPRLYAFPLPARGLVIDDANGLRGTMTLAYREPGLRVYLIEGRVERGRMGNPFPVGAKMVVIYKYWEGPKGFQSHLQTWTALDSAFLGVVTRPFRKFIQHRQEEFMAYIMGNMAKGGEFADSSFEDFLGPIQREGDPIAIRQFSEIFRRRS
jgi:hypothetical protein